MNLIKKNNPYLVKHLDKFVKKRLLIPFCENTSEIAWLASKGFEVVGVENRENVCENFFNEHKIDFIKKKSHDSKIKLYNGDFFDFTSEYEETFDCVWDRKAFWSVPNEIRARYVEHMKKIISPNVRYLAHTFDSELTASKGPPFNCKLDDLQTLFGDDYVILLIESDQPVEHNFSQNSLITTENLYLLKKFIQSRCNFYAF